MAGWTCRSSRIGAGKLSVNSLTVKILGFVDHWVSVMNTQLCYCTLKAVIDNSKNE